MSSLPRSPSISSTHDDASLSDDDVSIVSSDDEDIDDDDDDDNDDNDDDRQIIPDDVMTTMMNMRMNEINQHIISQSISHIPSVPILPISDTIIESTSEPITCASLTTTASTTTPPSTSKSIYVTPSLFSSSPSHATLYFDYPPYIGSRASFTSSSHKLSLPRTPTLRYIIADNAHAYNSVVNTLKRAGMIMATKGETWNIRWGQHMNMKDLPTLEPYQKINHFPGTSHLGRKDRLSAALARARRQHPQDYDFYPETYILPHDYHMWASKAGGGKEMLWIAKPHASSCGRGIRVITRPSDINEKKKYIICKYISNPYLINGCKFDMRIYVLVTSFDPLRIYLYENGLARFCTTPYSTSKKSLKQRYIHLTNYSVNKHAPTYVKNANADAMDQGSKWSIIALKKYLQLQGVDVDGVWKRIEQVIIKTLLSVEGIVMEQTRKCGINRSNCFELYGFDILLDDTLKPWLMEVNVGPSLSSSSPLDKHIKNRLMSDVFHTIGIQPVSLQSSSKSSRTSRPSSSTTSTRSATPSRMKRASSLTRDMLSSSDIDLLREIYDEMHRAAPTFTCIFPTSYTHDMYTHLFETERIHNLLLQRFMMMNDMTKLALLSKIRTTSAKSNTTRSYSHKTTSKSTSSISTSISATSTHHTPQRPRSRSATRKRSSSFHTSTSTSTSRTYIDRPISTAIPPQHPSTSSIFLDSKKESIQPLMIRRSSFKQSPIRPISSHGAITATVIPSFRSYASISATSASIGTRFPFYHSDEEHVAI